MADMMMVMMVGHSRAVSVVGLTLQPVVDNTERVAVAVVTAALHVEVEGVRLAAVTVLSFHVLWADAHTWGIKLSCYMSTEGTRAE